MTSKERAQDRKDMSEARLELLGLKKKQAMQAIDQAKSPSELRQAHQAAGGGGGRSRGRGRGRGAGKGMLEIIEEEEGSVGLPARAAESLASECDSSDCGDLDDLTKLSGDIFCMCSFEQWPWRGAFLDDAKGVIDL